MVDTGVQELAAQGAAKQEKQLTNAVHVPLIVLTSPAACASLKAPALGQSEPLDRQGQALALLQHHPGQRRGELWPQCHASASLVLQLKRSLDC